LPLITPYLHPGYHSYIDGANFASGGAGALVETLQGFVCDLLHSFYIYIMSKCVVIFKSLIISKASFYRKR
jgi:hypothetical protein